jgi:hypothetical protein
LTEALLYVTSIAYPTLDVEEIPVNCPYFGLLPTFGAAILCGALLWWGGVVSAAKNRVPTGRQAARNEKENTFKRSCAGPTPTPWPFTRITKETPANDFSSPPRSKATPWT